MQGEARKPDGGGRMCDSCYQRVLHQMDIEGYEWPIMLEWYTVFDLRSKSVHLPMQILVEIHHRTQR